MRFQHKQVRQISVNEWLDRENAETLKWYGRLLGADKKIIRKPQLINLIAGHLTGNRLQEIWSRLDDIQRAAVAETIYSPNLRFDETRFKAKFGRLPSFGEERFYYYVDFRNGPTLARLLLPPHGMPDELATRLREFVPEPAPAQINLSRNEVDQEADNASDGLTIVEMEQASQRDLKALLRLIREGKLRVSDKTGFPTAVSMKVIGNVLFGADFYSSMATFEADEAQVGPIKAFAWPLLLQAAKLAGKDGSRLKLTKAGEKAFTLPAHETLHLIWKNWIGSNLIDELRRIDVIKGQQGRGRATLTAVSTRREAISLALRDCPVEKWIEVDEFFRFMRASNYRFEVSRDPWDLYIVDSHYGSLGYESYHDWEILQGRYVLCLLFEYAATLGIVDVAYDSPVAARDDFRELWGSDDLPFFSRYDGLIRFRLTKLGAYCLGASPEYSPKTVALRASFTVMPSLRLTVNGELSPDERCLLELFADPLEEAEWLFSMVRTLKAIEVGHDVPVFVEFLQSRDEQPLPETVVAFFRDAAKRAHAIMDRGDAKLIECADAALAERIANADAMKGYCLRAGDRFLVVPSSRARHFRKELEKLGYICRSSHGDSGKIRNSVERHTKTPAHEPSSAVAVGEALATDIHRP
jgi:hypothetical protein